MRIFTHKIPVALISTVVMLSGCATPVTEQSRTGFISDYSSLQRVSENAYQFASPKIAQYTSFIISDVIILTDHDGSEIANQFSDTEIADLKTYFHDRLNLALTNKNGYTIVNEPGPGVATIRVAITALDASIGALNLAIYTKVTGAGLGGAAMEGEMVDSVNNEQLAAAVQWGSGSRVLRAGLTKSGDAKLQINRWTANLRQRIDDAHAQHREAKSPKR